MTNPGGGLGIVGPEPTEAKVRPLLRGWIHLVALVAMCIAGPILIAQAPTGGKAAFLTIYVLALITMFGVSASFHRIRWSAPARRRMRRADHSAIFIGIAGSYTGVGGLALSGWIRVLLLVLVWTGAVTGIILRQVWLDAPKWVIALPYVVVGWSALAVVPQLVRGLGGTGFALLLLGGAFYTAGAVVYSLRRPDPSPSVFGYHEIFHACTVVGAVFHFVVIAAFALPRS